MDSPFVIVVVAICSTVVICTLIRAYVKIKVPPVKIDLAPVVNVPSMPPAPIHDVTREDQETLKAWKEMHNGTV